MSRGAGCLGGCGALTCPGRGANCHSPYDPGQSMRASDVMVKDPMVAVAGAMASEVAIMFRDRNISVVPVVDDHRTRRFLAPSATATSSPAALPPRSIRCTRAPTS